MDEFDTAGPQVGVIAKTVGISPVRLEILRFLTERNGATMPQLAQAFSLSRNGVAAHVDAFVRLGAVNYSLERVPWAAKPTRVYTVRTERVEALAWAIFDSIIEVIDRVGSSALEAVHDIDPRGAARR